MSKPVDIEAINALLPQTQCEDCGYPGCKPYAEAITGGDAINKCIPGGQLTVHRLAQLLDVPELPLAKPEKPQQVAFIREDECIGCTKCIQACPVDAILGASKRMHTVIASECTGCDLCVEPCPVDCIEMRPLPAGLIASDHGSPQAFARARHYRQRYEARQARLQRQDEDKRARRQAQQARASAASGLSDAEKQAVIQAAIARTQAKKQARQEARVIDGQTLPPVSEVARLRRMLASTEARMAETRERLAQAAGNAAKTDALRNALSILEGKHAQISADLARACDQAS